MRGQRAIGLRALTSASAWIGAAIAAACLPSGIASGEERPARDRTYAIGRDGWSLERFGGTVAILRSAVAPVAGGAPGLLVLSCEGPERRLRLSLPDRIPGARSGAQPADATMLLKASGPLATYLVTRVRIDAAGVVTLAEAARDGGLVTRFVRLLKTAPERLDLLLGAPSPALAATTVLVLTPTVRPGDRIAFDDFLGACADR